MTLMYEAGNHLMICAEYADTEPHRHSAAHIMISLDDTIEVVTPNETITCKGILIPSGIPHIANTNGKRVLVFLSDNTTAVSKQIDAVRIMTDEAACKIRKAFLDFEFRNRSASCYEAFVQCVFDCNGITATGTAITDARIQRSLIYIQSRLHETITCADVAEHVFLSTGMFYHLFKEQVGMTFAAYMIYQRVVKTYTEIINGSSVTNAALDAGFSSSG